MRKRTALGAVVAAVLVAGQGGTASAAGGDGGRRGAECDGVRVSGELPVPPRGKAVRQKIRIGPGCRPQAGSVRFVAAHPRAVSGAGRQLRTWSEMYDCCKIRMTALYTTSTWNTAKGKVTSAATRGRQAWNREPWDAGWYLKGSAEDQGCTRECGAVSRAGAHAEFGYKGLFDPTGGWYANAHDTAVALKGDGTASCTFDVTLRHSFVGWNWVHGCG